MNRIATGRSSDSPQRKVMGENPKATLSRGAGRFFLASAVPEAVKCGVEFLQ